MEKYKKVTGQIVPIRTETIEKKFKNGQIKEIKTLTTYEYNGEEYIYFSGEYILYSKKGIVLLKRVHNKFGSPLSIKSSHQR
ncbi:MAG: hypothetical protein COB73_08995 [Flavobacteriaceae bacterium]|nr:MAG: hypothetical protein COB73_08995 [Flavobacteriaceae bacterium]